jgi:hypothetical protein
MHVVRAGRIAPHHDGKHLRDAIEQEVLDRFDAGGAGATTHCKLRSFPRTDIGYIRCQS